MRRSFSLSNCFKPFVGGKYVDVPGTQKLITVKSPANRVICGEVVSANEATVNQAVELAHSVYQSGVWSKEDVRARAKILTNIADNLRQNLPRFAELEVAQTGRALREMKAQLGRLPEWFEYFAAIIRTHEGTVPPFLGAYLNYVKRVPLGVVAQITPWNHPLLIAIKKIAPAIATGNSIVLKPSELAPISVLQFAELCTASGLPDGVLNVLPGLGPEVGQLLCRHPHVRKVDLTGGTETGRHVGAAAGANLASVLSELGGKAPMILFPDCDLSQAVNGCAFATFIASGQTCIMGARALVHESIYEEFVSRISDKASHIRLGDPMDLNTQMGPVISDQSRARISRMVDEALKDGAKLRSGGGPPAPGTLPTPFDQGSYYSPTVLEVNRNHKIWREEVFGPVLVCIPFKNEKEAILLANDSPFGLAAAVWTKDVMRAHRVADNLDVGIVWINDHHRNDPSSPWGGMKDSGVGRENGLAALYEYTQTRSVVVRTDPAPFDWFGPVETRYS